MARIEDLVLAAARNSSARVAIQDANVALSFADLTTTADRIAAALETGGIRVDEPVILLIGNQAIDVVGFLGIWRAGGVAVPVHRSSPAPVRDALTARVGARLLVDATAVQTRGGTPPPRALLDGAGLIIFTSGSTGEPKGVVLGTARMAAKLDMIADMLAWRDGDNSLVPLQLTFAFGQWATWLTLMRGGTVTLRGRFDPGDIRHQLAAGRVNRIALVPTMLRRLVGDGAASAWPGVFMSGGEALPAALGYAVLCDYPAAGIADIYGLTETGTSDCFILPSQYRDLAGTIGRPGAGIEHRIGADGELEIRSPWRMRGYLDAPDLTDKAMTGGWFRTGDLVRQRSDGALVLIGRSKDLVVRAGNKIAPLEIEAAFLNHPDIAATLAAGIADAVRGEALHLAVVPTPGRTIRVDNLRGWAAERLERYKLPDAIHVMDDLPAGATGKADRTVFRNWIRSIS